jgi:chromate transport protein ChrA
MSNLTYIILQSIVLIVYGSYVYNKYNKRKTFKALIKSIQIVSPTKINVSINSAKQR